LDGLGVGKGILEEAVSSGKSCITPKAIRPEVTHAELRNGLFLSSDGRKMLIYSHDGMPKGISTKIPALVIGSVLAGIKAMNADAVQILEGQNYYFLRGGNNFAIGWRKIERDFPQVEDKVRVNTEAGEKIVIDRLMLESMIKGVVIGLPSDEVKISISITGNKKSAKMEVSGLNSLNKKSFEVAPCGREKDNDINFPVSFKHFLDTLAVFKGDSVVDLIVLIDQNMVQVRDINQEREVLTAIPFRTKDQVEKEEKETEELKATPEEEGEQQTDDEAEELVESAVEENDLV